MHFKSLELVGFKSFADKTTIRFEPGVTAIVGPNGCGKSNIADGIRWVLGEQSAKSLRGSLMEDVIFNGAAFKEPLNFAEVSFTLSNEARILAIDYDEVTITRRLYRSGDSEYLLNKNIVRLRDIQELLLGTGIGTESYSIIEQGKMDLILSSRPEERRVIFEEAAGITKFKSKKKEALRKLEQTDQNLLRVKDIIAEVKRQIGSVERQAKKAEAYKVEFEKLKMLELSVASREFLTFETRRKEKETGLGSLKEEEGACAEAVNALEAECRKERENLSRYLGTLQSCREKETMASANLRRNQDRSLLNRERIGELGARHDNLIRQIQVSKRRVEEFRNEYDRLAAECEAALSQEKEANVGLHSAEVDASMESLETSLSSLKDRRIAIEGQIAKAEAKLEIAREAEGKDSSFRESLSRKIREFAQKIVSVLQLSQEHAQKIEAEAWNFAQELLGRPVETSGIAESIARWKSELEPILAQEKQLSQDREQKLIRLTEVRSEQGHLTAKRQKFEKDKSWVLESIQNEEAQLEAAQKQIQESVAKRESLEAENSSLESEAASLSEARDGYLKEKNEVERQYSEAAAGLERVELARHQKEAFLKVAREKLHRFELEDTQLRYEMDRIKERIYNAYQVDLAQVGAPEEFDIEEAKAQMQAQRDKLTRMGPVNLVALEEFGEMQERYDFLTKQEADLLQAKDDLHKAILKINRTTRELFVETFAKIQKHFADYFRLLFIGGSAELLLADENDVLESGIEIVVRPPGKKLQNISLLSGGEKALTAIALLFSLFKVKPSPFCVLDEIDAPLDESNVDRFSSMLKDFIGESQFIVITHNKRTMSLADALYGITMAENGVSRVVSVRISEKPSPDGLKKDKEEVLV
ncbi:MAG: AAA family ATPase [Candidatus Omnitrophica bacterium]|nr:AAA family ATPase [Candidatus Omnitrophota bacterium]